MLSVCLFTPFFHIKSVEVTGNDYISSEQILETAAVPMDTNIFRINKGHIKKSLLTIPEIENVKIRRILPSKVRLEVSETRPVLLFPYLSGYVVTNETGRVLALVDTKEGLDLIEMSGLEIKTAEIYKKISVQDKVTFDIMLTVIQSLHEKGLLGQIRSCHFDSLADVYLYLNDGTKVIIGKTSDLDYKLSVLSEVLPQIHRTEGAYVDLTIPERTVTGTLEPTPAPEPTQEPGEEGSEDNAEEPTQEDGNNKEETDTP
ncbi:MAG: FtsQ-type POTRA domain-containing protein [Clostridia bacterium]|nr:FtsQ-type POTRA domain-containing protein [Clostridia bacterium]